eukprot:311498_1
MNSLHYLQVVVYVILYILFISPNHGSSTEPSLDMNSLRNVMQTVTTGTGENNVLQEYIPEETTKTNSFTKLGQFIDKRREDILTSKRLGSDAITRLEINVYNIWYLVSEALTDVSRRIDIKAALRKRRANLQLMKSKNLKLEPWEQIELSFGDTILKVLEILKKWIYDKPREFKRNVKEKIRKSSLAKTIRKRRSTIKKRIQSGNIKLGEEARLRLEKLIGDVIKANYEHKWGKFLAKHAGKILLKTFEGVRDKLVDNGFKNLLGSPDALAGLFGYAIAACSGAVKGATEGVLEAAVEFGKKQIEFIDNAAKEQYFQERITELLKTAMNGEKFSKLQLLEKRNIAIKVRIFMKKLVKYSKPFLRIGKAMVIQGAIGAAAGATSGAVIGAAGYGAGAGPGAAGGAWIGAAFGAGFGGMNQLAVEIWKAVKPIDRIIYAIQKHGIKKYAQELVEIEIILKKSKWTPENADKVAKFIQNVDDSISKSKEEKRKECAAVYRRTIKNEVWKSPLKRNANEDSERWRARVLGSESHYLGYKIEYNNIIDNIKKIASDTKKERWDVLIKKQDAKELKKTEDKLLREKQLRNGKELNKKQKDEQIEFKQEQKELKLLAIARVKLEELQSKIKIKTSKRLNRQMPVLNVELRNTEQQIGNMDKEIQKQKNEMIKLHNSEQKMQLLKQKLVENARKEDTKWRQQKLKMRNLKKALIRNADTKWEQQKSNLKEMVMKNAPNKIVSIV